MAFDDDVSPLSESNSNSNSDVNYNETISPVTSALSVATATANEMVESTKIASTFLSTITGDCAGCGTMANGWKDSIRNSNLCSTGKADADADADDGNGNGNGNEPPDVIETEVKKEKEEKPKRVKRRKKKRIDPKQSPPPVKPKQRSRWGIFRKKSKQSAAKNRSGSAPYATPRAKEISHREQKKSDRFQKRLEKVYNRQQQQQASKKVGWWKRRSKRKDDEPLIEADSSFATDSTGLEVLQIEL
mmetsp:Transcript_20283/g.47545  ORF Transcript_20283/g.47545 Transcript_20283/m.47545 type:complete len:246 (-) Transcript_20283:1208-1945(-)